MIPNEIRQSLALCCSALNNEKVEYLTIGGVAVAFYGYHRISGAGYGLPEISHDIDFWYNPTNENYLRLLRALSGLAIEVAELEQVVFNPKKTYLRIPFGSFKMEFLPQMVGLDKFVECQKRANNILIDSVEIKFIGYSDLIQNKKLINRPIDKQDIVELEKRREQKG